MHQQPNEVPGTLASTIIDQIIRLARSIMMPSLHKREMTGTLLAIQGGVCTFMLLSTPSDESDQIINLTKRFALSMISSPRTVKPVSTL